MYLFIVGTGRCGTKLLRRILNLHDKIYLLPETHWVPTMYNFYGLTLNPFNVYRDIIERTFYVTGITTIDFILKESNIEKERFYSDIKKRLKTHSVDMVTVNNIIYTYFAGKKKISFAGDATPDYGFYMSLLQQLWPESRFIHIIRDGKRAAISMSQHPGFQKMVSLNINNWCPVSFNRYYTINNRPYSKSIWSFRKKSADSLPEGYLRLWEQRLLRIKDEAGRLREGTYYELRYEDLLLSPKKELSRIADFLGIHTDEEWLSSSSEIIIPDKSLK